ncbi:MAG: hypothetical protein WC254_05005 [Candidatus Woesearchaeota archaeon]|jgi:hypothetical protein
MKSTKNLSQFLYTTATVGLALLVSGCMTNPDNITIYPTCSDEDTGIKSTNEIRIVYTENQIINIIEAEAENHHISSSFLKAMVDQESHFDPYNINYDDGIEGNENWNSYSPQCVFTSDGYPHGVGLLQLTGLGYQGFSYPYCLDQPDNNNIDYFYSMNMNEFGRWINMTDVTPLCNPFDPQQNIDRFLTGYAVPYRNYLHKQYPHKSEEEILAEVAFSWRHGLFEKYNPNTDYIKDYFTLVEKYESESN